MSLKHPTVSVLMPAYNAQDYIAEAIESILNQTFSDFEFIIIDDGSTDNTPDIIKRYAEQDSRIRFIQNTENCGIAATLNHGIGVSRGKYIARMDADDISLPDRFARQVEFLDTHANTGILGTWYKCFDGRDDIETPPENMDINNMLDSGHRIGHPTVMIRKSVLNKHKLRYNSEYVTAQDYDLWSRAIMVTQIQNLPVVLLKYRIHPAQISDKHHTSQQNNRLKIREKLRHRITNP